MNAPLDIGYFSEIITVGYDEVKSMLCTSDSNFFEYLAFACV